MSIKITNTTHFAPIAQRSELFGDQVVDLCVGAGTERYDGLTFVLVHFPETGVYSQQPSDDFVDFPAYAVEHAANGYPFECACGEHHRTERSATLCRKCRAYLYESDVESHAISVVGGGPLRDASDEIEIAKVEIEVPA